MFGPSGSGRAVGGAAGGRRKGGGVASGPGAVLGVADAVSCGGGNRGGSDAGLAVQGLVVSGGAVMSRARTAARVTPDLFPAAADPPLPASPSFQLPQPPLGSRAA